MKEHQRKPRAVIGLVAGRIDDAVQCRRPQIVGPLHHQIADVDDEPAGHCGNVDPFSRLVVDLQSARTVFYAQDGQAAVVGMRAGAQLTGQRFLTLIGIFEHAEHADVAVDLVVEVGFGQIQAEREDAHERPGEVGHRLEIFFPGGIEIRDLGWPEIGRKMRSGSRTGEILIVRHNDRADRKRLLEIAGRFLIEAVGQPLITDRTVAANLIVLWPLDRHLLGDRQVEKNPRTGIDALDQRRRNAMSGDDQETDVAAGFCDRLSYLSPPVDGTRAVGRDVDDRYPHQRHRLFHPLARPRRMLRSGGPSMFHAIRA